jgi:hypothetical protein
MLPLGSHAAVVFGNGKVTTEKRSVAAFSALVFDGSGTVRVHRGSPELLVTLDSNLLGDFETRVVGDKLLIGFKPGSFVMKLKKCEIDVTIPELTGIEFRGSGKVLVDAFSGKDLAVVKSGSGRISGELKYETVKLDIEGSGIAEFRGSAAELDIRFEGAGAIRASDLVSRVGQVSVKGSGAVDVKVDEELSASLVGSGHIRYWGNPRVRQNVSGAGSVRKSGD